MYLSIDVSENDLDKDVNLDTNEKILDSIRITL